VCVIIGNSGIFETIQANELQRLEVLIRNDPQLILQENTNGITPLMMAVYYGRSEMIDHILLLESKLNLYEASALGELTRLRDILRKEPKKIDSYSPDGYTPLGLASFFGQQQIAEFLVYNGADVNKASANSMLVAPLHSAAAGSHTEIVKLLLFHRANPNLRQQHGWLPLHAAAQNGQLEIIRLLLHYRAKKNVTNDAGKTPYDIAVEAGKSEAAALLAAD
jgi:uncharacterized protein